PAAGISVGEICRTQQPRFVRHEFHDLAAIPTVIAAADHLDAALEELFHDFRRDSEAGCGVLAVRHDQIGAFLRHQVGQALADDLPARGSDDVSDEEYANEVSSEL